MSPNRLHYQPVLPRSRYWRLNRALLALSVFFNQNVLSKGEMDQQRPTEMARFGIKTVRFVYVCAFPGYCKILLISCTRAAGLFKFIRSFCGFENKRTFRNLEGSIGLKLLNARANHFIVWSLVIMANSEDNDALFQSCSVRQTSITAVLIRFLKAFVMRQKKIRCAVLHILILCGWRH